MLCEAYDEHCMHGRPDRQWLTKTVHTGLDPFCTSLKQLRGLIWSAWSYSSTSTRVPNAHGAKVIARVEQ